ncbi:MAG: type II secretion system minor pseudopilin GspJ [Legionella sp.]|nr:type II secretion system minor pseudopilin GspJ [Legionella sp.]
MIRLLLSNIVLRDKKDTFSDSQYLRPRHSNLARLNVAKVKSLQKGFTLIEILIALSIFAIIATITATIVGQSFHIRERITKHADQNNEIWSALMILQREVQQIVSRSPRTQDSQLIPAFIGESRYFEFTRGGFVNPSGQEHRSQLKRVAYVCRPPYLVRRTWPVLDPVNRHEFQDKILLRDLEQCHFAYLNQHLQVLSEWNASVSQPQLPQNNPSFPKAIQFNIGRDGKNNISGLAIVPSALYADI